MKLYEAPELRVEAFESDDVMTASLVVDVIPDADDD